MSPKINCDVQKFFFENDIENLNYVSRYTEFDCILMITAHFFGGYADYFQDVQLRNKRVATIKWLLEEKRMKVLKHRYYLMSRLWPPLRNGPLYNGMGMMKALITHDVLRVREHNENGDGFIHCMCRVFLEKDDLKRAPEILILACAKGANPYATTKAPPLTQEDGDDGDDDKKKKEG